VLWRIVVPVKEPPHAKSRLQDATGSADAHGRLVRAIQLDTIEAVAQARTMDNRIASVHVVGSLRGLPRGVDSIDDPGGGLNAVLTHAANHLAAQFGPSGIIALVADLPALRAIDLLEMFDRAAEVPRGFVPDWAGTGTTTLTARPDVALQPMFGARSAQRHVASGAVVLQVPDSCRMDVDTRADLARCLCLGVGQYTAAALAESLDT